MQHLSSAVPENYDVSTNYYHGDHLGFERLMTNVNGYPVWSVTYAPYGMELNAETTVNHYKFTGYERDDESGNDYAMARHYASYYGRFFSPDPLGGDVSNPQSLNRYAYVMNNPINATDPTGLCDEFDDPDICGAGGGGSSCEEGPCPIAPPWAGGRPFVTRV